MGKRKREGMMKAQKGRAKGRLSELAQRGGEKARESDVRKQRLQAELRVKRCDNDLKKMEKKLVNYCANPSAKVKDTRKKRDMLRGAARPWVKLQEEPDHLRVDHTENLWEKHMGQFCQHDMTANYICLLLDAAECCMENSLHKKALSYLDRALMLDSSDMFGAHVLQVVCSICLGKAKNVVALLSDDKHTPSTQLRDGRPFTYKSSACRKWIIAAWKYLQWRQAVKHAKTTKPAKGAQTPVNLEEEALAAVTSAHLQNPYMIAPFCYADVFGAVVEYLEEIDSVSAGSVEEGLLLSSTLQELLLEHKSFDGAGFSAWLRTFTTDLPLVPHPLLDGVDTTSIPCEDVMYRGMFVSGCEAVREEERLALED